MVKYLTLVFVLSASLAGAQWTKPPNLEGWKLVESRESNLEAKVQAEGLVYTAYFGYIEDYQNPETPGEFIRVIKRYVPVISIVEDDQQKQTLQLDVISNYSRKASRDALSKVRSKADAIGYTRWQVAKDQRTGEDIRTGAVESWLRIQNGDWLYDIAIIEKELYSEISPDTKKVTLVGIKFTLGSKYHIMKVDQADLMAKKEGGK